MYFFLMGYLFLDCVLAKPALFMKITGYIEYTQLKNPITMMNLTECGLWCRDTALCRGMAVTETDSRLIFCRLIQFDEYRFSNTDPYQRDEQIYLQKFSVWNEAAFDFKNSSDCPVDVRITEYLDRLNAMKLTECPTDFPVSQTSKTARGFIFQDIRYVVDNTLTEACEPNSEHCLQECPGKLQIEYASSHYKVMHAVIWPALCYNGEWMYFDAFSQIVYPVKSWSCMVPDSCTPGWTNFNDRCFKYFQDVESFFFFLAAFLALAETQAECVYSWIGLYYNSTFLWSDQSPVGYMNTHLTHDKPDFSPAVFVELVFIKFTSSFDPLFLMRINGFIHYKQLDIRFPYNFTTCALWCRHAPSCRGIAVQTIENNPEISCRLMKFGEYKFTNTNPHQRDEQIHLRKFSFWNEAEFDFKACSVEVQSSGYIQRLEAMKLTKCPLNIPVYSSNKYIVDGGTTYILDNIVAIACQPNRHYCQLECLSYKKLVIEYEKGKHIFLDVSVLWLATCYDGVWMYFDTWSQLAYPVKSWNCAVESELPVTKKKIRKITAKKATTNKATTKKATTKKAVTTKTTRKITTKTTTKKPPVCSIPTRKIWRSTKTRAYFIATNQKFKTFTRFCHSLTMPRCCGNLSDFGIIDGGEMKKVESAEEGRFMCQRLFRAKKNNPADYRSFGLCANKQGLCNANTPVYEYYTEKTGYAYAVFPPENATQKKFFCYFWHTSAKQCNPEATDIWFQYEFPPTV